jgi:hypothetical protein
MSVKFRPTDLVKWDKKNEPTITFYLKELLDILEIKEDGRVETTKGFSLMIFRKILVQNLILFGIDAIDVREGLVFKTVFRLKKFKKQDIYGFRRSLASEVKHYLDQQKQSFVVLFPLHVSPNNLATIRQIRILESKLVFTNWSYVKNHFDFQTFLRDAELYLQREVDRIDIETRFVPVMVYVEARNAREGFDKVSPAFDLMRAIFNLYDHYGRYNIQWGGYPRPIATILPPPLYCIFKITGEFDLFLYNTPKMDSYNQNAIDIQEIRFLRKIVRNFRTQPTEKETLHLLTEALQKYGQAHETNEWRLAFLLLWQVIELITLQSSEQLNMKQVINRAAILLNKDTKDIHLLSALYETRNELVHKGYFPDEKGLEEVSLIKNIAERVIGKLFDKVKKLPTISSLQRYYDHASSGDSDLSDRSRVINIIIRDRKKT